MQKLRILITLLCTAALLSTCKKSSVDPGGIFVPPPAATLVKTITGVQHDISSSVYGPQHNYTNTNTYSYTFDGNNLLKYARYDDFDGFLGFTTSTFKNLTYGNNLLTGLSGTAGPYTTEFVYNSANQIVTENFRSSDGKISSNYQITYKADGKIDAVVLNLLNSVHGGKDQAWTLTYNYGADGLLALIVETVSGAPNGGGKIYFTGYSDECDFNPWIINDIVDIDGFFPPVALATMKSLPLSIRYVFDDGTGTNYFTYTYTINNRRIDQITKVGHDSGADIPQWVYSFSY